MPGVRFAPSPTGTFHIGNLRTAWISREWARRLNLPWVVRFENIDAPRNAPGARESQTGDMARLGLVADVQSLQSDRAERHWETFLKFREAGLVYPCDCSRKEVREAVEGAASAPHGPVAAYSGRCRDRDVSKEPLKTDLPSLAWRIRFREDGGHEDFVVARSGTAVNAAGIPERATFVPAYHWACAVDDHDGRYDLLVRAWDLEPAAAQQRLIMKCLALLEKKEAKPPAVFHASLVTANDGSRLEKRTLGVSLKELLAKGETPEALIAKFQASFTGDWKAFQPEKVFGETQKTMTLHDLSLRL
ncbi:MAG TPA: glutamate--tRNA ligase family protein [bacterium]|nr:glutamate--tRNA ligase family protein [bacterium]